MILDQNVWGPHFWFFLHTIAISYPNFPNSVIKKKYYDFIQNIPLFIPIESMSSNFSKILNKYPVQAIKFGIVPSFEFLSQLINSIKKSLNITLLFIL